MSAPPDEPAREPVVPYQAYRDLLGQPYEVAGRCWGLVTTVLKRIGVNAQGDFSDDWRPVPEPQAGDVVSMKPVEADEPHAGVYLGLDRVIHATRSGVAVTRLSLSRKAGGVVGYFRHNGRHQLETVHPSAHGVTVVFVPDLTRVTERSIQIVNHVPGQPIAFYAPAGANVVGHRGELVGLHVLPDEEVPENAVLMFGRAPGDATLIALGIGIVLSFLSSLLTPAIPGAPKDNESASPTFDLSGLKNTALVGIAQPLGYGEHIVGGNIIEAYQNSDEQGRSILNLTIFLSRGPIHSIAGLTADFDELTGAAIPDDIKIDGSPARNYGAVVSGRLGNSDQEPLPGSNAIRTAVAYTHTLQVPPTGTAPFASGLIFSHITETGVDGFEIIFSYPLGLYNVDSSGNVGPRSVYHAIRWRLKGTATWTTIPQVTHTAQRRGTFTRQFQKLGLAAGQYEVQVERFAHQSGPGAPPWPETDANKESRSDIIEVNEIVTDALWYPGKALLKIRVVGSEQLSGALPTITAKCKLLKVWVWDGVSETSPAFGSAKVWSDNPAWCMLDMLLNPNHGLSRNGRLRLNDIGLAELKAWADNCDTLVSDGRGSTTKRATFDYVVDEVKKGWEFCQAVAKSHWARLFNAGGEIRAVVDKVTIPTAILNMGNLKDVSFSYRGRRQRPNVVEVSYFNEETNFEADIVQWPQGGVLSTTDPIVKESFQAIGVTRACQAYRLARFFWNLANLVSRAFEGTCGRDNIHLLPFDVAEVQHSTERSPTTAGSGRVLAAAAGTVTLDQDLFISGTFKIKVRTKGTGQFVLQERTLSNVGAVARGVPIAVTVNWNVGDVPALGDPFQCGQLNSYFRPYRLMQIETDPPTLERKLQGTEYDDDVYDDDPGTVETFTDTMPDPRMMPGVVSGLRLVETTLLASDGSVQDFVRVEFNRTEKWHGAKVWYRIAGSVADGEADWIEAACCAGEVATIGPFAKGAFVRVAVTPTAKQGTHPHPDFATTKGIYIAGRREYPPDPLGLVAEVTNGTLSVRVTPPADARDVVGYQVRYGSTWAGSIMLARCAPADFSCPTTLTKARTIMVRSVGRTGIVSYGGATFDIEANVATSVYVLDSNQAEEPTWPGGLNQTVVDGSSLALYPGRNDGSYDIPQIVGIGNVQRVLIDALVGFSKPALRKMSECAFRMTDPQGLVPMSQWYLDGYEIRPQKRTMMSLTGIPMNGLVATCMKMTGVPIDVLEALSSKIERNIDGAGPIEFIGTERFIFGSLDVRLNLKRPHERYDPQAQEMATVVYDYA